jgi:hypothetical protein
MSTSQHENEWTGIGEMPADDDFAAALEREHSATARMLRGDEHLAEIDQSWLDDDQPQRA